MSPLTSIGLEEKVCTTLGTVGSGEGTGQADLNSCFLDPWADTENQKMCIHLSTLTLVVEVYNG